MLKTKRRMKIPRAGIGQRIRLAAQALKGAIIPFPAGFDQAWIRGEESEFLSKLGLSTPANAAAQHPYLQRAMRVVAESLMQAPLRVYAGSAENEVTSGPVVQLLREPNPIDTQHDLLERTVYIMLQSEHGALWRLEWGGVQPAPTSFPVAMYAEDAKGYSPRMTPDGVTWIRQRDQREFGPLEMIWFRFPDPENPWKSLSPVRALTNDIAQDIAAGEFNSEFFANGARLGLVVTTQSPGLTQDQARELEEKLNAKHSGRGARFRTAVLGGAEWNVEDFGATQRDMEFIEQRRFHRETIRAAFGVGPLFFGDVDDANRANVLGQERVIWRHVLLPLARRLERTITTQLLGRFSATAGMYVEFDTSQVEALQDDFREQVDIAQILHGLGFTGNELNEYFEWGFEDADWRGTVFRDATKLPAEDLLSGGIYSDEGKSAEAENQKSASTTQKQDRAERVKRWRQHLEQMLPLERKARGVVGRWLIELRAETLRRIESSKAGQVKDTEAPVDHLLWDAQAEGEKLVGRLQPVTEEAVKAGGNALIAEIGASGTFDLMTPAVEEFMRSRVPAIVNVSNTVRRRVERTLLEGLAAGESNTELKDRVRAVFNAEARRAQVIVRTEVASAYNNGRAIAGEEQGVRKWEWLTAGDEDVRDSHIINDGVVRESGQPFPNGLTHPHEPGAPAEEVVNCRCTLVPVMEE